MPARPTKILDRDRLAGTYADLAIRLGLLALFIYWSFVLVRPFLPIIIWSVVIAVALYPIYEWVLARLGNRRRLAAFVMTLAALLVVIGPATWLMLSIIDSVGLLLARFDTADFAMPRPPDWVKQWPIVGEELFKAWELAATNIKDLLAKALPHLRPVANTLVHVAAGAGLGALQFLCSVLLAGFLFAPAPTLITGVKSFAYRVDAPHGETFVRIAAASIRSVALGVVGISALQAILAAIGLFVAGVPAASLLTTAILILGIIQIGPAIVILPLIVWSWMSMETMPALAFTVYMLIVSVIDNVLKPFVMKRGLSTPAPIILIGVIGGTLSHGITGLFLGPIILAVIWELASEWIGNAETSETKATADTVRSAPRAGGIARDPLPDQQTGAASSMKSGEN